MSITNKKMIKIRDAWIVRLRKQLKHHASNRRSLWLLIAGLIFVWITLVFTWAGLSPNIQVLNLMIWFGCVIALEDQIQSLWPTPSRLSLCVGGSLLSAVLLRGSLITSVHDRFTLLILPLSLVSLALLNKPIGKVKMFVIPLLITLLFPIGVRILELANYLKIVTAQLSWLILAAFGFNPVVTDNQVMLPSGGVTITGYCTGVDQLMICLVVAAIFLMVFPLRNWYHRIIAIGVSIVAALLINAIRIAILALLVSLPSRSGMSAFEFLHDSYGGLLFSLFAVGIFGWVYTLLIDREIASSQLVNSVSINE